MRICVLGAGAWGTALAISAAAHPAGHHVVLWGRDAAQVDAMARSRANPRYLAGVTFPTSLLLQSGDAREAWRDADLVVLGTPMAALRAQLAALAEAGCTAPVAWLCKGVEPASGLFPHEVQAEVGPRLRAGLLSGPSFALEVAQAQPTALVAASADAEVRERLVAAFHGPALRVYGNDDVTGVEVGGAVKNVLAIATGLADGLALGLNARAALITRGLTEMTRLGIALGGRAETFMGLSGLGDLVLTATGHLSRNRRVGLLLAEGQTLDEAVRSLGHVAEGVNCARAVVQRARQLEVEMPIAEAVVGLLDGRLRPADAVAALMAREPAQEI
ncbi:glycerol-3-phosphate dehydrogenase (NAD(P)+) [Pseudacidovorax intermedius]|uniref:Glycerol-3-phosphate dehydrogenase [NAD(P)+] n=3 Tax=Pseudacidovorax intermedius TaxID=433924 RepID=A0A370FJX8_9BURK|nr:NAD(P)H-dependent glycerol-3-phosphate dehydrogenase [Pseudacidovorax intermedius]RDI26282.1 glycerol-3-phosphate dehydrogenase (NAD(P)+) [Pseudacidovorax intermedius]